MASTKSEADVTIPAPVTVAPAPAPAPATQADATIPAEAPTPEADVTIIPAPTPAPEAPTPEADVTIIPAPTPAPEADITTPPAAARVTKDRSTVVKRLKQAVIAIIRTPRKLVTFITKEKPTAARVEEDPSKAAPEAVAEVPVKEVETALESVSTSDATKVDKEIADSKIETNVELAKEPAEVDIKKPTEETPASVDVAAKSSTTT